MPLPVCMMVSPDKAPHHAEPSIPLNHELLASNPKPLPHAESSLSEFCDGQIWPEESGPLHCTSSLHIAPNSNDSSNNNNSNDNNDNTSKNNCKKR